MLLAVLGLLCIAGKCGGTPRAASEHAVLSLRLAYSTVACLCLLCPGCAAQEEETLATADDDLGASRDGSRTDAEVVER